MAVEPESALLVDLPHAGRPRDVAPLGPGGPNPLHLHAPELDVLRCLSRSQQPNDLDDPVWDELEALGLVEMHAATSDRDGSSPRRYGVLTSLGRRYRID
jgi:hypothetical protein